MLAAAERQEMEKQKAEREAEEQYGNLGGGTPRGAPTGGMRRGVGDPRIPDSANVTGQGKHDIHPHLARYSNVVHVVGDDDEE